MNAINPINSTNALNKVLPLYRAAALQFKCVKAVLILTLCVMLYVNGNTAKRQHSVTGGLRFELNKLK